jgi:hypothetical protein
LNGGRGTVGYLTGGWGLSGTTIFQSGYPLTAGNTNGFLAVCADGVSLSNVQGCSASNPATSYQPNSGDYNADGDSNDYPNVVSYAQSHKNNAWLNGAIPQSDFAQPTFGQEGNENAMQFRGPNFFESNINLYKDTHITERVVFQFRFEVFNLFNRANYANVDVNIPDGNFGQATGSHEPRFWQLGGKISF